jgi:hypothetical protein
MNEAWENPANNCGTGMDRIGNCRYGITLFFWLCMLSACAADPHWSQQGKSDEEMRRDHAECRKLITEKYGTDLESPHFTADLDQCMQSRGYRKEDS